jgi:hypothetical protein
MNDTPTPRTDALIPTQENGRTLYDHVQVMEIHARQLERELADMTKQRDHYKAACDQYSEDEMLCKLQEVTKQRDALAGALEYVANSGLSARHLEDFAQEALAATKGEKP